MSTDTSAVIIEPEALYDRLNDPNLLLVQVTSREVFEQAHLPGAVLVEPRDLVCGEPPAPGRLPDETRLGTMLASMNYDPGADIVVYDDEGGGWAGRMAWTLDIIGHPGWTYLNGGMHAWQHAGLPFESGPHTPDNSEHVEVNIDTGPIAEIEDVLAAIEDPDHVIWDVRSAEEYAGTKQNAARAGHIPGAVNLDWMMLKDPSRNMRLTEGIAARLTELGIMQAADIITHCQSHHRSGLSYMLGRLLGLPIRAYHGSWSEWGNRDDTPIEVGSG